MSRDLGLLVFLTCCLVTRVTCDFACLCTYAVETEVRAMKDSASTLLGYMYEFDCKELYALVANDNTWTAIAFQKQVGYIQKTTTDLIQNCPGNPDAADIVASTSATSSTSTTAVSSIAVPTTTLTKPHVSTTNLPTTAKQSTAVPTTTVIPTTAMTSTAVPTTAMPSTTVPKTVLPTTAIPSTAVPTTALLTTTVPITAPPTTAMPSTAVPTTALLTTTVPITAPPTTTMPFTAVPTTALLTTTVPITAPPTTAMPSTAVPSTALPTTTAPTTAKPITVKPSTAALTTSIPTYKCPSNVATNAWLHGGHVTVHSDSCFEIVPQPMTWHDAEHHCNINGGHLAYITSQSEEDFILTFGFKSGFWHSVWIGLSDQGKEEHWTWTSGYPFTWSNWYQFRFHPQTHYYENCVALVSYGKWDDLRCGVLNPSLCRYDAHQIRPVTTSSHGLDGFWANVAHALIG